MRNATMNVSLFDRVYSTRVDNRERALIDVWQNDIKMALLTAG